VVRGSLMNVYRLGYVGKLRRTGRGLLLDWLLLSLTILALPLFLVAGLLMVTFLLILSGVVGFRVWSLVRRWRKEIDTRARVIDVEYRVLDGRDRDND